MDDDEPEEWKQLCSALYDGDASWVHSLLTDCSSLVHYRNTVVSARSSFLYLWNEDAGAITAVVVFPHSYKQQNIISKPCVSNILHHVLNVFLCRLC
jgi:hypothetical protein